MGQVAPTLSRAELNTTVAREVKGVGVLELAGGEVCRIEGSFRGRFGIP